MIDYITGDFVSAVAAARAGITWTGLCVNDKHRLLGEKVVNQAIIQQMREPASWCHSGEDLEKLVKEYFPLPASCEDDIDEGESVSSGDDADD